MWELIETPDGATYFAERVWAVSLRYDLNEDHPLLGRSAPDFALSDGRRVGTMMRDGRGLLVDFTSSPSLLNLARRWAVRIGYAAGTAQDEMGLQAVLVRPDGIVAWASDSVPDEATLGRAATRWFGA